MTKFKKVVAMVLAFLMIFSSASVLASAWDVAVDDGNTLEISTKFFKEVDGEWVETEKVAPGTEVKARVYLATDYFANDGTLLFFYDKDFFTHSYASGRTALEVNPAAGVSGYLNATPNLASQVAAGYIDSAFLAENGAFAVNLDASADGKNVKFDDSTWLFEFTLTVSEDASGEAELFVKDTTVQSTERTEAAISIPKGPEGGTAANVYDMWLWDANVVLSSQPVSTLGSVTFNANGGKFADGAETVVRGTDIGDAVTAPDAPSYDGYTFIGWIDAADSTPTYEEAQATVVVDAIPEEAITYNAFWIKNVTITFNTDGGSEIAPHENVTPYTDFADVADPTKDGYTFLGWDKEIPETYPDVDTTYTATWALNVTVSFDTDGGTEIPSVDGYAGQEYDFAGKTQKPTKEGHRFAGWSPALPAEFPAADTTYKAIYETKSYSVYYYVDGELAAFDSVEYGAVIPTEATAIVLPGGKALSEWYTDADCTTAFVEGTTMGTSSVKLYAKTVNFTYNAIFDANGGAWADGDTTKSVPTEFEALIEAPKEVPVLAGYVFTGWTPYVGTFDEAKDMTFYATWAEAERNVEYYSDGNLYDTFDIATGGEFESPAEPYKEGYTFVGWATSADSTETVELPATMPALAEGETLKYYAVFEINTYTVTWDVDGETTTDTFDYNEDIVLPEEPTKTGYTFAGWEGYTEGMKMPANDVTFKAQWTVNEYDITWIVDGVEDVDTYEYLEEVTAPTPTKPGYVFAGWDGEVPKTMPAEDLTFTGSWAPATDTAYTVNIHTMGADGQYVTDTQNLTGTTESTVYAEYTVETGFKLGASSVTSGVVAADGSLVLDVYLDRETYTMSFETNGGNAIEDITGLYGSAVEVPANPTKTGYVFGGWYAEAELATETTVATAIPAGNVTYYAKWNAATDTKYTVNIHTMGADGQYVTETQELAGTTNETVTAVYTVEEGFKLGENSVTSGVVAAEGTLVLDVYLDRLSYDLKTDVDGVVTVVKSYLYGATIEKPADAANKEGYTFAGWSGYTDGMVMPIGGVTVTATWTTNVHNITWVIDGENFDVYENVEYGTAITAPTPEMQGYDFSGWEGYTEGMTMPDSDVTFTGSWISSTDTKYTVEIYTMNTEGGYDKSSTVKTGTTGETAKAEYTINEGFKLSETETSVLEGVIAADDSLVLKVYIDRISYELKTNVDGTEEVVKSYLYGATIAEPAAPTDKAGYTFGGWDGYTAGMAMPVGGVTLTATWNARTDTAFKVVINYADAATGAPLTKEYQFTGTTGYAVEIADEEGSAAETVYVVRGDLTADDSVLKYYKLDESAANEFSGTIAADGTTVLNLYYVPVVYTATFDANEGAWSDGVTKTAELNHFQLVAENLPADPAREGYKFAGWIGLTDSTVLSGNRTFLADWTKEAYTLKFDTDGGSAIADKNVTFGETIEVPANPTKTGYTFASWDKEIPATIPDLGEDGAVITYTASWTINKYDITWNITGEGTYHTDKEVAYGTEITAPEVEKQGYVFSGWEGYTEGMTMPDNALTFTGAWTPATDTAYTVNIHTMGADGQYVTDTQNLTGTTESTVYAEYTVETGFKLGASSVTSGVVAADGSLVLDVYLDRETYTMSFETDGGNAIADITGLYGSAVEVPANPTKTGYVFGGWYAEAELATETTVATAIPAGNVTYYAKWNAATDTKYTVNIHTMGADGQYVTETQELAGTTNETVTAVYTVEEGFKLGENSVTSGVVAAEGTLVLDVYLDRLSYDLKTDVDGVVTVVKSYLYGATIEKPADAANKEGYTFAGWSGYTDGMVMPIGGVTVTATWTTNVHNITWVIDGENFDVDENVEYGTPIVAPTPEMQGYDFSGWEGYTEGMTMPDSDVTFTGSWISSTDTKYTVEIYTMNTEGGYDKSSTVKTGTTGETAKAEYTINEGFKLSETETSVLEGVIAADDSLVLKVYIDRISYELKTNVDGTEEVVKSYLYGATIAEPAAPADKAGYTFGGWDGYTAGMAMPVGGVTLTAKWNINSYDVIFYTDENMTETVFNQNLEYNSEYTVPTATKTGYVFAGWYNVATGAVEELGATQTVPASNVTYYATWTADNFTLTYRTYNDIYEQFQVPFGTAAADMPAPAVDPAREGYVFSGWAVLPETMPAEEVVIGATWTKEKYTLKFDTVGGSEIADMPVTFGEDIEVPEDPTKAGYVFAGWDKEIPATIPDLGEDGAVITYTASWNNATDTKYVVNIHTMNANGAYETATQNLAGTTGDTVYAEYTVEEGFELSKVQASTESGVIAADGSLVLDVYLDRLSYDLKTDVDGVVTVVKSYLYGATIEKPADAANKEGYTFAGWSGYTDGMTMPVGGATLTATWTTNVHNITWVIDGENFDVYENVEYGTPIVAPTPEKQGYEFSGWEGYTEGMAMPDSDVTFTGSWISSTDTKYTVEIYTMNTAGTYDKSSTVKTGTTGETAKAEYTVATGFKLSETETSVLEGVIAADDSLVLKVYLDRIESTFTVKVDDDVKTTDYLYGAAVAAPATPVKEGYTFTKWVDENGADATVPATMPEYDVTLVAEWEINKYDVTWNITGEGTYKTDKDVAYGTEITAPEVEKQGYVFSGWEGYTEGMTMPDNALTFTGAWAPATDTAYTVNIHTMGVDGQYVTETQNLTGTTEATVSAVYTVAEGFELGANSVTSGVVAADGSLVLDVYLNRKTVTITFANTGDSEVKAISGLYGAAIEMPGAPSWDGYRFDGWDATYTTIPAADVTVNATWVPNNYTVTWVVDGETKDIDNYDFGEKIVTIEDPAKAGYTFAGWMDADGNMFVDGTTTMISKNVVYTAQWNANDGIAYHVEIYKMAIGGKSYELDNTLNYTGVAGKTATYEAKEVAGFTYNAEMSIASAEIAGDGSTVLKIYYDRNTYEIIINGEEGVYYYGEEIEEPAAPAAAEGYKQDGWVDENGSAVKFPFVVDLDNPAEIKANWVKLSFNITWIIDGAETKQTYEFEEAITAPDVPAKDGHRFAGWKDATGKVVSVPATMPASDLEFTAVYETATYVVNYYVDGKIASSVAYEYGDTIRTELDTYTVPEGYAFDGWYTDEAMETKLTDGATVESANTKLYAKTVALEYDAIFDANGGAWADGDVTKTFKVAYEEEIIAPADPVREGYDFLGWSPYVGSMDELGKSFIAVWQPTAGAYTVTYWDDVNASEPYEVFDLAIGQEFEVPAEPYKEGWSFVGWASTPDATAAETLPTVMPAENLVYYAIFSQSTVTVTYYDYAESEFGPAGPVTPEYVQYGDVQTYAVGETIKLPAQPEIEYYIFTGWVYADGTAFAEGDAATENTALYATYKREVVKLVPVEGKTTMIERDGEIESYNEGYEVITDSYGYEGTTDFSEWYVYGFDTTRLSESRLAQYFEVSGDGYYEIDTELSNGGYGTGAVIKVYDNHDTSKPVEEFFVVFFGDIDGNGRVNATDTALIAEDVSNRTWSANSGGVAYMKKAASIDGNSRVAASDIALLKEVTAGNAEIDQIEGIAE